MVLVSPTYHTLGLSGQFGAQHFAQRHFRMKNGEAWDQTNDLFEMYFCLTAIWHTIAISYTVTFNQNTLYSVTCVCYSLS